MGKFDLFAIWKSPEKVLPVSVGSSPAPIGLVLLAVSAVLLIILLTVFIRRFRSGKRGYREAMIMGGAVLAFLFLNEWAVLSIRRYTDRLFVYFDMVLLYETAFPLCIFAAALIVSNLVLLVREGVKPRNLLAILIGVLQIVGMHVAFALNCLEARWAGDLFIDVLADILYILFLGLFYGLAFTALVYTLHRVRHDRDYIIVLGCAVFGERVPPLLGGRIDRAIRFQNAQKKETGKAPVLLLSGGQGPGEDIPEAEAMRRYALSKGVPAELLLTEDRSRNTEENFRFSKEIADSRFPGGKGAFSTTNFHLFRSEILCREAGLSAEGLAAPTKWYFIPNALVREIAATLARYKKRVLRLLLLSLLLTAVITVWQWLAIHPGQGFFG